MKRKTVKRKAAANTKLISLKLGPKIHKQLIARANEFADGNLSAWLRHSGLKYKPRKGEKVILKAA